MASTFDRHVLVTTDFAEGPGDFANTDLDILAACDADGREIPGEIASGTAIWFADRVDFRNWGLMFDTGYNGGTIRLDDPNADGKTGIVAFARGRNAYLPGALCETEPEVQSFWLRCLDAMLDAGVDGVDFGRRTTARTPITRKTTVSTRSCWRNAVTAARSMRRRWQPCAATPTPHSWPEPNG